MCLFGLCSSIPMSPQRTGRSSSNEDLMTKLAFARLSNPAFRAPQVTPAAGSSLFGSGQDDLILSLLLLTLLNQ
ncbi:hypothetical protein SKAU_G00037470 [Synaphobranchus kaupii]|uniref:Uncharacterized protein n=1 Tax=Synaphobranchus kaupii TaxID=118154 RepID=A0A9Q1GF22_SYNKA|nr:hypothetical protein SKAU_G00037470 [Synaphobranchus kaupii]